MLHLKMRKKTFTTSWRQHLQLWPHHDMKLVIGDFNAQIGPEKEDWEEIIGKESVGTRSDNGEKLLNFLGAMK